MPSSVPITIDRRSATGRTEHWPGDAVSLAAELQASVAGEVRFDAGTRGAYSTDASNYRQVPIGVVVPRDVDDVVATVAACRRAGAPVLPRGGGTSLAGQCCNVAVVLDFSKYMADVEDFDPEGRLVRVQPGLVLDDLGTVTQPHGLIFPPDPSTHDRCTIGGMVGNNSCGVHSVMAGKTIDNVEELEVLLYDGTILRLGATTEQEVEATIAAAGRRGQIFDGLRRLRDANADLIRERYPQIPRRVSGYNLDQLLPENGFNVARSLVGTEGTCVTVLSALLRLSPMPSARVVVALGFPDVFSAADAVPDVLRHEPSGLEGMDDFLIDNLDRKGQHADGRKLLPDGGGWLLAEVSSSSPEEAEERAHELARSVGATDSRVFVDPEAQHRLWEVREAGLGATARVPARADAWPGWEDSAVAPERLGHYLRDLDGVMSRYGYEGAMYGHFGDGCLHLRLDFDLLSADGVGRYRAFIEEAADLVIGHGGSLSGEHGDGQARGELLVRMYGPEMVDAFRRFKAIWDPDGMMNPGKVVDPRPVDSDLRLGSNWRPWNPETEFGFPNDGGSLVDAALRCVGVGECRKTDSGTMCPSYMVTRDEQHSTRGRARLLFEMLEGDPVDRGWRSEAVREALDLCLSCKACKSECPVNVDMATYKAEFLSHHYERRLRPRSAYSMGLIPLWARVAGRMPRVVNLVAGSRVSAGSVKRAAGVSLERSIPRFAPRTFRRLMDDREAGTRGRPVVLWPDTFTNHFSPEVGVAAVEVLEDAGWRVELPRRWACCARPLYEFGMIRTARRLLARTLRVLSPHLRSGTPIVLLEPSCASVFRDELVELMPHDQDAHRLAAQTRTLAELLDSTDEYEPPRHDTRLVVQRHCHHGSILGFEADEALLRRTGGEVDILDSGCCGMAGSFGYEPSKYDVSTAIGERMLLPEARDAEHGAVLVADGFSCRTQISEGAGRTAMHLAQVLNPRTQIGRSEGR